MSKDLALDQTIWDVHENQESFVPLEFTEEIKPDLFGLEVAKATEMVSGLSVTIAERKVFENTYIDVIELPITTETLPVFKELRLKIVKNRTQGIEKWHKNNKAFYLAGGRFIDAVKNKEVAINEQMESKLMEAEKFFENEQKTLAKELNDSRIKILKPYGDFTGVSFAEFSEEDFDDYVLGKKTKFENAQKEAETESLRIEGENKVAKLYNDRKNLLLPYWNFILDVDKDRNWGSFDEETFESCLNMYKERKFNYDKQQEKIKAENNRLKAEADAKEKALEKERDENQRLLTIEKSKSDKIIAEAKAKADAEAEKLEAERLLKIENEKAPIKLQLNNWINSFEISKINIDNEVSNKIIAKFDEFKNWAKKQNV